MPCCRGTPPKSSPASDSEAEETEDSYRDTPVVGSGSEEDNDTAQEGEQPDPSASVASTSAVASAPIASVVEPSTSTSQSPKKTGRLVLFKGSEEQDDPEWKIGGKYKVRQKEVTCWSRHSLDGEQNCELKRGDVVLLIALKVHEFTPVGLISPPPPVPPLQPEEGEAPDRPRAGWIALEDHNNPKAGGPLLKTRLKTSWEIGARYAVKTEVTLRERAPMNSDEVCKLQKDEEVLVVELGIDQGALGGGARLRAKVATDTGAVGWMSPETPEGFQLLDPINLLSAQAVDVHRRSLKARKSGRSQDDVVQSGPRFSWQSGLASPWKVGGQYRLLESSELRSASDQKSSSRVCKLNASTIVVIEELGFSDNNQGVVTPMARVKVADGAKDADGDKSNPYQSSINPQCHPYEIARQAAHVIGDLCTNWYGNAPDIVVTDAGAQPFPFVPRYLFYILSELLKNSVRASIEHHGMMTSTSISDAISEGHVPPIQVLVSSDANMSSIRISDEGGGIPVDRLSHAWSYLYTTAEPIHVPTTQASVDAPTDLRRLETGALPSDYSLSEASDPGQSALIKSPLAGLGCGLPLSRLYARCLGGQLKLHTLPRVGCDVFVYLNRLGHCNDEDLDSNRKRAEIAQEISRLQAMMAEKRQEG